jgi:hypothetical protein
MDRVKLLVECEADIEVSDYDYRTVGHLAAAESKRTLLFYLSGHTDFNFTLRDRWNHTVLDEIKDHDLKDKIIKNIEIKRARGKDTRRYSVIL